MPRRSLAEQKKERIRYWERLYGFTFVLGGPFSFDDCKKIEEIEKRIAADHADIVEMADPEARHLSLATCDDGRSQPCRWKEKADFPESVYKIVDIASRAPRKHVSIHLLKVYLDMPFILLKVESDGLQYLRQKLASIGLKPIVEAEDKFPNRGHITLGVAKEEPVERVKALSDFLRKEMSDLSSFGTIKADKMTVAHYRIRSFDKLLGSVVLSLGEDNSIDEDQFWRQLNLRG